MNDIRLYSWLAYLGAVPFVIPSMLILLGYREVAIVGDLVYLLTSYGLVIVVFMSGIHWGNYLIKKPANGVNLFLTSNIIAISAWLSFLFFPVVYTLLFYSVAFALLLSLDYYLQTYNLLNKDYFKLRVIVTGIVIFSLLVTIASIKNGT